MWRTVRGAYRSMIVMRGATSVDAQAAAAMSARIRWGRCSVFHFDGVRGRGDGREEKGGLSAAASRVTEGAAGSGCSGSSVIVAECFGNVLMGHSNDGRKWEDRISIFKFYLRADTGCGEIRLPLDIQKTHNRSP